MSMLVVHFGECLGLSAAVETGGVSFDSRSQILTVGPVKMRVKQGDITKEKVDVIINSTNERIDMTNGTHSLALINCGMTNIIMRIILLSL